MLPASSTPERTALNRVTFGARDNDVATVQQMGWENWVEDQLNPPAGDDSLTKQLISEATLRITYGERNDTQGTWPAVDEDRPLNTLSMTAEDLWGIYDDATRTRTLPQNEINRISEEVTAATWIRNTHSAYQVREFMVDFWHRHFNVSTNEGSLVTFQLPIYDQEVIRRNALGNFTKLVNAVGRSTAMLFYLDNAVSRATTPNENYARELLELHTMGADAYLGVTTPPFAGPGPAPIGTQSAGFSDQDILQASRALSGWTVAMGQRISSTRTLPSNGKFVFEPTYHNRNAQFFLGVNITSLQPATNAADQEAAVAQGDRVIELASQHEKAATFVVTKIVRRMFGDNPPQTVIDAAVATWLQHRESPDQIKRVMRTILLSAEIMAGLAVKIRRPYEKIIAFARVTNSRIRPSRILSTAFAGTRDSLFLWASPDGWPDENAYWLSSGGLMTQWNTCLTVMANGALSVNLRNESLRTDSVAALLDDWISRMVGYEISSSGYAALRQMASQSTGISSFLASGTPGAPVPASAQTQENELRRLVALIATAPEFAYR
jgi:uncharacterized protein (DUF1800 family)